MRTEEERVLTRLSRGRSVQIAHHADHEVPDFPRVEKVVKFVGRIRPGRLLDIGYCPGSFADYLTKCGWTCTGLDICPRTNSGDVRTVCADAQDGIPFRAETFDVITAGEVIEHVIDQNLFLQECGRVLKRGGWLVVTTPNLSYLLNRILVPLGQVPKFVYAPYHYHFHTRRTLVELLEANEFLVRKLGASHVLYSRRRHPTGRVFEALADLFPTLGAHLLAFAQKA